MSALTSEQGARADSLINEPISRRNSFVKPHYITYSKQASARHMVFINVKCFNMKNIRLT